MGCGSCGTGKPNGCKSNGGCSTGGCNRMNTYDWLRNLPINDADTCRVVEVSFSQGSRKDFYRNTMLHQLEKGDMISVEGVSGFDVGEVSLTGEVVRLQLKKRGVNEMAPEMKKILRRATDRDLDLWRTNKAREAEALIRSRAIARQLNLNMKMSEVEFQADGKKATFYYIADDRVDFREMIKIFASEFRVKVEMRQIGARQESGKVGGIGSCGRELCCATWLTDFKSVNTAAARYQNLSINQTKLSGQCGRLKCCLNYELDTYLDALQGFPENADILQVAKGTATLIKKDIFKNLMWYVLPQSNKQYPLTIERVRKIKSMNMQGAVPDELEAVEVVSSKVKEVEPEFVDVVGHISLRSLEKADKKRRDRGRDQRQQQQKGSKQLAPGTAQPGKPNLPVQKKGPGQPQQQKPQGSSQQQRPQQGGQQQKPGNMQQRGGGGQQQQKPQTGGQRPQGGKPQQQRQGGGQQQQRPQQGGGSKNNQKPEE
ncbi:MAG TPA: regulatory iron-sulfur-containing complex subunit RicT [Flavisolibacter sp.]|nr:regulatory iron-sulfur-containing complex subunit RicT [Flavisolibacter sp.]